MFTKTQTGSERLRAWREFRLNFSSDDPQVIVDAFSDIKPLPRYLDYYTSSSWPNVFEIVNEGYFCQSGITLIMASTLLHFDFISSENLQFDAISNHITGADGLVLIDQDVCYNFLPGKIVSLDFMRENSTRFQSHIIATDKLFD